MSRRVFSAAATGLLLLFLLQGLFFIRANSQTSDEAVHLAAGVSYLLERDFRLNQEHPPLMKEVAALPLVISGRAAFDPNPILWERADQWRIGLAFLYESRLGWQTLLTWGRLPILLCGVALVALVGWWAYRLWGPGAALLGMGLASFEPNLIAHASLVTTDLGAALFVFASFYLLWEYLESRRPWLLVPLGLTTGLALAAKYSAVALPALLAAVAVAQLAFDRPRQPAGSRLRRALGILTASSTIGVVAVLVIVGVYAGGAAPTWLAGLGRVMAHGAQGHDAFFLGEFSEGGWWSYFLVAFFIKTPLGTLALISISLALPRLGDPLRRREALFLLAPVAALFAVATIGGLNIGLRHVLPVYPFLFVAASRVATFRLHRRWLVPVAIGALLASTAVSSLRAAPHYLAYFNEIVGGPANGHRFLGDSNIDWGQDLGGLEEYMRHERLPMIYLSYFGNPPPSAHGIRYQYLPSWGALEKPPRDVLPLNASREMLAISVSSLQGIRSRNRNLYAWLREREPEANIGHSIHVYDITGDVEAHLDLARTYLEAGPRLLAIPELRKVLALEPGHGEALRLLSTLGVER